jgi:hypothetical protein
MTTSLKKNMFEEYVDEIHSFDAYYKNVIFYNNNLLIPYINLGVSNHPLNETSSLQFLDYSYMVFENIKSLSVYICNRRYNITKFNSFQNYPKYNFGGEYLDYNSSIFNDLEIYCEKAFLFKLETTKISDEMWVFNPDLKYINIDMEYAKCFFDFAYLPEGIKEVFPITLPG